MDHDQYCFPDQRETTRDPAKRSKLSVQFGRILASLDILGHSFHDLRYTYVTECDALGIPLEHIARSVGHVNTSTTRGYIHK